MLETVKMSEKKHHFAITYHDGFIYVFGGYDCLDKTAKKSCAKFSVCNEGWDLLPTLRRARNRCHSLPISSNKIAVFGGVNGGEPVAGIEMYNFLNSDSTLASASLIYMSQASTCHHQYSTAILKQTTKTIYLYSANARARHQGFN